MQRAQDCAYSQALLEDGIQKRTTFRRLTGLPFSITAEYTKRAQRN